MSDAKKAAELLEERLEYAYWVFDGLRKRPKMPMAERDAFKTAVRGLLSAIEMDTNGRHD